jgi:hypothetical protein
MHLRTFRKLVTLALCFLTLATLSNQFVVPAQAGIRGPGKYSGVVIFDRWDTCFLLSGPYVTYISNKLKNQLRPYQDRAMQVDASDVFQPMNPGDALIKQITAIRPAPVLHRWATIEGLQLRAESDFGRHGSPAFLIQIHNVGLHAVNIDTSQIGPTLLGPREKNPFSDASDGDSVALITRGDLLHAGSGSWSGTIGTVKYFAGYKIDPKTRPPDHLQLEPGTSMRVRITFKLSPGQYQFLFGYGGGVHEEKSLASNAIGFDLNDRGFASLAQ